MRPLSERELSRMRDAAIETMFDTCEIGVFTDLGKDERGQTLHKYEWGGAIACGVKLGSSKEVLDGSETTIVDAIVRLPFETVVRNVDILRVTRRHGEALAAPIEYRIVGDVSRGPSALVANCKEKV